MGSSMVMMWSARFMLMKSINVDSVVDLPLPVGPVTTTRPLVSQQRSSTLGGTPIFSTDNSSKGI